MSDDDWYDQMQVCLKGHQITAFAMRQPNSRRNFCSSCGSQTIDACEDCGKQIRGYRHLEGVFSFAEDVVPTYCDHCGAAFPWQRDAIENLKEIIRQGELNEHEISEIEQALPDIISDGPKTQSASYKLKRLLPRLGAPVYTITVKIISDLASEAAKKAMGLG